METVESEIIGTIKNALSKSINYNGYREELAKRVANYIPSTDNTKPDLEYYAKLNHQRMSRLEKQLVLEKEVVDFISNQVKEEMTWLLITEGWCGDAAQSVPYIFKMAQENKNIDLRLVYRDQNLELMDQFLTDGGRSIPKLIFLDKNLNILGNWGPRPEKAQELYKELKIQNEPMIEIVTKIQKWYVLDKGISIQKEIIAMLKGIL